MFVAMNTEVVVHGVDAARVAPIFAAAERRFSRFRDDSELSRINRADEPVVVSAPMFDALIAARRYVELTGGIFDPAIGGALVALGYDRSFAAGALDRECAAGAPRGPSFLALGLDPARRAVTRPSGMHVDLGGMIKGRTVDEAAAACLGERGAIDAGGDIVVRGAWVIDVEDPRDSSRSLASLRVRDAAVATSAANRRRWRVARSVHHHLVDPRTQRSAITDLLQVTVIAPSAELAEVVAKTVFVLGARQGRRFVERMPGVGAVLVGFRGDVACCGDVEVVS